MPFFTSYRNREGFPCKEKSSPVISAHFPCTHSILLAVGLTCPSRSPGHNADSTARANGRYVREKGEILFGSLLTTLCIAFNLSQEESVTQAKTDTYVTDALPQRSFQKNYFFAYKSGTLKRNICFLLSVEVKGTHIS